MEAQSSPGTRAENPGAARFLSLVLLLFAGSGCSALIYEIVWYQLLQLAIGSTAISLGIVLATFMGGLCLGSLLIPRLRSAGRHPLRVYAALELGIGILGILVLVGIPLVDRIYVIGAGYGFVGMMMRGLMAAVCLLPPTMLMGATLPIISRWVESTPRGVSWWGLLYGGNTAGAVFGCLFAGFYLLRIYNMATATFVAAAINLAVAAISFGLAAATPKMATAGGAPEQSEEREAESSENDADASRSDDWTIYLTIAISGACALGAEVVWTRLMGMMLGATVYVFSIILAVFLIGLALGSLGGSWVLRAVSPRLALGWCQVLLTMGIAWAAYMIADSLPYWPINPLLTISPWYTFQLDLVRCLWAILPAAILWGASFPLALASVASHGKDSGRVVGGIYAANTFGAIVGALGVSLVLVPWIGTQQSQRVLLVLAAMGALFALVPLAVERKSWTIAEGLLAAMIIAGLMVWSVDAIPGELIAYGRRMAISAGSSHILYTREGRNSSVAISQWNDGAIEVDVNGHVEATTEPYDMKLQRMVGHLPALLHPHPQSVLGIGFGAGVSAGTFTRYPTIKRIVVCEIEPAIPPTSTRYFATQDYDVMHNSRTQIIFDDARHYVLTTHEKYDIIASDPLDVFVKGTAALYSKEYFEAVKNHLNLGGMFTLYVPLYESDEKTVKSEIATFMEAFPYGTVWANTVNGLGYDLVLMGQLDPLKINLDEVQARLASPDYAPVAESLREIGINSAVDLFGTYAGDKNDLAPWLEGAEINRDGDMRLQYLAGWGINSRLEDFIYRRILSYRRAPWNIFTGSPEEMKMLQFAMAVESGTPPQQ